MKIFISTDLEGPSGVIGRPDSNVGNVILRQEIARRALTNEVNACIEGLLTAGADEIVVCDGHGNSDNLDIFELHEAADLLQCAGGISEPIDYAQFDAVIQLGAHAMQQSGGYLCHTFNSHGISSLTLNREPIGEIGIGVYQSAYFGVPTILVSGDEAACAEARLLLGEKPELVPTKKALARYSVLNYAPKRVYRQLREAAEKALRGLREMLVVTPPAPCELQIEYMCPNQADAAELQGMERVNYNTVRCQGRDFYEAWARFGGPESVYQRVLSKLQK